MGPTRTEYRTVSIEKIDQPNCGGKGDVNNTFSRSRTIEKTYEWGTGIEVSANGSVSILGTGVDLGTTLSTQLGYTDGTAETLERSLQVSAPPGTHMLHTISQREVWDVGEAKVEVGGQSQVVPFSLRHDFDLHLDESFDIGCDATLNPLPSSTPSPSPMPSPTPFATWSETPTLTPAVTALQPPLPISMPSPTPSATWTEIPRPTRAIAHSTNGATTQLTPTSTPLVLAITNPELTATAAAAILTAYRTPTPTATITPISTPNAAMTAVFLQAQKIEIANKLGISPESVPEGVKLDAQSGAISMILPAGDSRGEPTIGMEFVYVPAGEFLMGSTDAQVQEAGMFCKKYLSVCDTKYNYEKPQHKVKTDSYWIGKTEVTNAQFRPFVESDGYTNQNYWTTAGWQWRSDNKITQPDFWNDMGLNGDTYPVIGVSWYEAMAYTAWLKTKTGWGVRLPTEAEWEKAARGEQGLIYPWGKEWDVTSTNRRLNYCDNNCINDWKDKNVDDGFANTASVGSFPNGASPYNALDMAGNVWEWNSTLYAEKSEEGQEDVDAEGFRLLRGGSSNHDPSSVRGAFRHRGNPSSRNGNIGFRVAFSVSPGF